jgi:hypothetical protein
MKKLLLFVILALVAFKAFPQKNGFGVKAGLSSTKVDFNNGQFSPQGAETGYHFGLFGRVGGAGFFVQPEVLFTQTSGKFINDQDQLKVEFNRIDVPVMLGVRFFKIMRLQAGPIASLNINSKLSEVGNTIRDAQFKNATLGYQAGFGVDIGNLFLDAKYEGGLSKWTENIGNLNTDNRINQWVVSVGFKIF